MSTTKNNWLFSVFFHTGTCNNHSLITHAHPNIIQETTKSGWPFCSLLMVNPVKIIPWACFIIFTGGLCWVVGGGGAHLLSSLDFLLFNSETIKPNGLWIESNYFSFLHFYRGLCWWEGRTSLAPSLLGRVHRPCKLWHFIPPTVIIILLCCCHWFFAWSSCNGSIAIFLKCHR